MRALLPLWSLGRVLPQPSLRQIMSECALEFKKEHFSVVCTFHVKGLAATRRER